MNYFDRTLESVVLRASAEFPVVVVTGPRQSGKTTLLRHALGERARYVSLEPPDVRAAAETDPRGFLAHHAPPVIFDEVQYAPTLLPYLKELVDAHREHKGQFLLTGSQNLLLLERVTETLAGRAAILSLLPFTRREADRRPDAQLPWEAGWSAPSEPGESHRKLWESFLRGGFPELIASPGRDVTLWLQSYVQTYLERDVRALRQVGDLTQFQLFLRALAARSAQLLNLTDLARDLGVAVNTAKAWLAVLEATHQVLILRPYFANIGKRLVKTPKIYFTDIGLLCHLVGLRDAGHAAAGPMSGAILETAVITEVYKTYLHRGLVPALYFWRTSNGHEVDLLVQHEGVLVPIEVKQATTPLPRMAAGISALRRELGKQIARGYVVHPGEVLAPLGPDATAIPFSAL